MNWRDIQQIIKFRGKNDKISQQKQNRSAAFKQTLRYPTTHINKYTDSITLNETYPEDWRSKIRRDKSVQI